MGSKRLLASVIAIAVVLTAGATAWAVRPRNGSNTITVCYGRDGLLRLLNTNAGKNCRRNESELSWSAAPPSGGAGFSVVDGAGTTLGDLLGSSDRTAIVRRADGAIIGYEMGLYNDGPLGHVVRLTLIYHSNDCTGTPYLLGDSNASNTTFAAFGAIGVELNDSQTPVAAWRVTGSVYVPTEASPFLSRKDPSGQCVPESDPRSGDRWISWALDPVATIPADAQAPVRFVTTPP